MRTTIRKAVGAAIGVGCTALGGSLLDGNLTGAELLIAAGGALLTFGGVWKLAYQVPQD